MGDTTTLKGERYVTRREGGFYRYTEALFTYWLSKFLAARPLPSGQEMNTYL